MRWVCASWLPKMAIDWDSKTPVWKKWHKNALHGWARERWSEGRVSVQGVECMEKPSVFTMRSYSGSFLLKHWRNTRVYAPAKEANRTGRKKSKEVNWAPHKDISSPRWAPADGGLSGLLQLCIQQKRAIRFIRGRSEWQSSHQD